MYPHYLVLLQAAMIAGAILLPVLITIAVMSFFIFYFLNRFFKKRTDNIGALDVLWVLSVAAAVAFCWFMVAGFFRFLDKALVTS
jgi:uncharacterized membrane protein